MNETGMAPHELHAVTRTPDCTLRLSQLQCQIILQHGYPFDEIKREVNKIENKPQGGTIHVSNFYLTQLIGDLSYSCNRCEDEMLQVQMNELCEYLEGEESKALRSLKQNKA
jgi:hypothetical protein